MNILTPKQIAKKKITKQENGAYKLFEGSATTFNIPKKDAALVRRAMILAVETDRAQRDLYELIAQALDERAERDPLSEHIKGNARRAAREVRHDQHDDLWDRFIRPMLDQMQKELGR